MAEQPLLSVVVPAYDVEDWLEDSLTSVLDQSWSHLEVVVVDDGATDRTGEIADEVAARDPRVRVVHQANAGLGAARNVGVTHATGELLAFADSDDLVVPGAYERLVGSLVESGSDLAIGAVERLRGDETFMTPLMRENHREPRRSVVIEDAPLLLADVFAWNKVFRRSFWDAHGLAFPERVRYEDQPAITRALVQGRIDSLPEPVYRWRVRDDGTSISQQRGDVRDLADRLETKRWSLATVREHCSPATQEVFLRRVLPIDMWEYFRAAPDAGDDYWALLRDGVRELWNADSVPFEATTLPLRQRIMGWLVGQDRREALAEFLTWLDDRPPGPLPTRLVDGRTVAEHPYVDRPDLPPELQVP
ncbi:glycosyltransferase family 2 protein [Nocardioides coralli]|uniref:glycosyltransferase family 2 protein n=1 Tax=Nocardioides coralli TaxID=2872154 RepID=UPI001CA3B55E|nr:glycosyltransferase [Nocardioides coralli]QZY29414.1 glycosyltransferase [Nocardioides coralli]